MRRIAIAIAFVLAAAPAAAQTPQTPPPAQNVPATYQLRVAGPTYFTNGDVKGDALVIPFGKFGEAITIDVISGPTLCDVKTPVRVTGGAGDDAQNLDAYVDRAPEAGTRPRSTSKCSKAQAYRAGSQAPQAAGRSMARRAGVSPSLRSARRTAPW